MSSTRNFTSTDSSIEISDGTSNTFDVSPSSAIDWIEKNKKNLIICAGLTVCAIFVITVVDFHRERAPEQHDHQQPSEQPVIEPANVTKRTCDLLDSILVSGEETPQLIHSDDYKSLASFRGYLEFFHRDSKNIKNREKYQLLRLKSVDWLENYISEEKVTCQSQYDSQRGTYTAVKSSYTDQTKSRRLRLNTDCATIEFRLMEDSANKKWLMSQGSIVFDNGLQQAGDERRLGLCNILPSNNQLDFAAHHHYQCKRNLTLDCAADEGYHREDPIYIKLRIEELEYELNGHVDEIKDRRFSKPLSVCDMAAKTSESKR